MKVRIRIAAAVLAIAVCMALTSCGPRMRRQPSIRTFSRQMPDMPEGAVPTAGSLSSITRTQSQLATNPLPRTKRNLRNGKVYYGYYCLMCHGEKGDGQGPVGIAYIPRAADLTASKVSALSDGEIYRKMLAGTGHAPVMEETVLPDQRWPLVMHVRTLAQRR